MKNDDNDEQLSSSWDVTRDPWQLRLQHLQGDVEQPSLIAGEGLDVRQQARGCTERIWRPRGRRWLEQQGEDVMTS